MKQTHNESIADTELVHHVCHRLEKHSHLPTAFDSTLEQLAEHARLSRQARLQHAARTKKWVFLGGSLAVAASVALVTLLPLKTQFASEPSLATAPITELGQATAMSSVDPQLLQDMEMLMVLAEESQ
ncbi:MAG: hypothetical protein Q7U16_17795 [Agitococcus sp.]|jgi:hypothetical protein|nr:hypothetical protein [Agitococcus sp.]